MDREQPVNENLRRALLDLAWLNRRLGANHLVWASLKARFRPGASLRLLDLATGGADIPRFLVDHARRSGCRLGIDAVDFHPATLALATEFCREYPEITLHQGDARSWSPPLPGRYDLVLCTLALHHFSRADAVAVLRNMRALGSSVLVLDLERSGFNTFLIALLTRTLIHNPMTVHDARASIRAAFTTGEIADLAREAGWADFRVTRHFPARLILRAPSSPSAQSR